jgi:cytoskeletal protein CcmA (bactofilin family)
MSYPRQAGLTRRFASALIAAFAKEFNMFSKTDTPLSAPPRSHNTDGRSIIASDLKIIGDITSTGSIEINGEVEGAVTAQSVVIGTEGRLTGQITAEILEVRGKVEGNIAAGVFTLRAASVVTADVNYVTIVIESGAQIDGHLARIKG